MKKSILLTAITVVLISSVTSVMADISKWTLSYEANKLPNQFGFAKNGNPTTAEIIEPGIFHLNTIDTNAGAYYYRYVRPSVETVGLNSDTGYTVEMRAKLIKADVEGDESAAHIDAEDGREDVKKFWGLNLYSKKNTNYAVLRGASVGSPVAIGDDFHVFRITVAGEMATLYLDGVEKYSVKLRTNVNTNQVRFGDLTGKADADWQIDYIRIYNEGAVVPIKSEE